MIDVTSQTGGDAVSIPRHLFGLQSTFPVSTASAALAPRNDLRSWPHLICGSAGGQ